MTDMLPTTTGPLGQQNPIYYVLETPYVFLDDGQADKVLDGPVGEKFLKGMESKGLIGLAFWENGFREISNNVRPLKAPQDLKGVKLRVQQNRLHIKYFGDLGASPTPMAVHRDLQRARHQDRGRPGEPVLAHRHQQVLRAAEVRLEDRPRVLGGAGVLLEGEVEQARRPRCRSW